MQLGCQVCVFCAHIAFHSNLPHRSVTWQNDTTKCTLNLIIKSLKITCRHLSGKASSNELCPVPCLPHFSTHNSACILRGQLTTRDNQLRPLPHNPIPLPQPQQSWAVPCPTEVHLLVQGSVCIPGSLVALGTNKWDFFHSIFGCAWGTPSSHELRPVPWPLFSGPQLCLHSQRPATTWDKQVRPQL